MEYSEAIETIKVKLGDDSKDVIDALGGRLTKVNNENASLRTRTKEAEGLKTLITSEFQLGDVTSADDVVKTLKTKMQTANTDGKTESDATISKLTNQIGELQKSFQTAEQERQNALIQSENAKKTLAIKDTLIKSNVIPDIADGLVEVLAPKFKKDTQGDFVSDDGKLVGEVVTEFLKGKDHFIKDPQKGGSGSQSSGGTSEGLGEKSADELFSMVK